MTPIPTPAEQPVARVLDARDLIGDGTHVGIMLDGQHYVLRITRAGKLILTK